MSSLHLTSDSRHDTRRGKGYEAMNPRERLLGMLALILVLLLALLLRSM